MTNWTNLYANRLITSEQASYTLTGQDVTTDYAEISLGSVAGSDAAIYAVVGSDSSEE